MDLCFLYLTLRHKVLFMKEENINPIEQIQEIKKMMQQSSRFISLSGLSGVFAGFFALAGAAAFYVYLNKNISLGYSSIAQTLPYNAEFDLISFCVADAAIVLILSLLFGVFFTTRKAQNQKQAIWNKTTRHLLINLIVPLITGGLFCLILLYYGIWGLVAPATLIFYGLALLNASKYTLDEIKYLALTEIILGLIACFFIGYGLTFWAIGFGVMHIVYGLIMYVKYEANPQPKKYW